jgi:putative ABC transport system permease protein
MKKGNRFLNLFKEGVYYALNSASVNKLRTFLSLFGVTIGIFSIISVFTVIDWLTKSIGESISSLGENLIYIHKWPWGLNTSLNWWDIIKWPPVTKEDHEVILRKSLKAENAFFTVSQTENIRYMKNIANEAYIIAVTHEYEKIRPFEIEKGRFFSPEESSSGENVAILGSEIATRLFAGVDPVGKHIIIKGKKVMVIGVFMKEGKGGITDSGLDELTVVPLEFGKTFINMKNNFIDATVAIKAKEGVEVDELSDEAIMILRAARRLKPDEINNFSVNRASTISQSFSGVFAGINIGGGLIGGLAILVGGFGIANIMFVSVRERTNQIGIQKALGAKRSFILQQFLVESVLLSLIGGLLGIILVLTGTVVINYLWELNMYLTLGNATRAIIISGLIGIIAGYAPAYTASRMRPVEAIGYSFG